MFYKNLPCGVELPGTTLLSKVLFSNSSSSRASDRCQCQTSAGGGGTHFSPCIVGEATVPTSQRSSSQTHFHFQISRKKEKEDPKKSTLAQLSRIPEPIICASGGKKRGDNPFMVRWEGGGFFSSLPHISHFRYPEKKGKKAKEATTPGEK